MPQPFTAEPHIGSARATAPRSRYIGFDRTINKLDYAMTPPPPAPHALVIAEETPDQPAVLAFFGASEAYMGALYPAESNHFAPVQTLLQPNVRFLVARTADGRAVGCGAIVKSGDGTAEIKRMWIEPDARGMKLGVRLLDALIDLARADGQHALRLETGIHQPEAIGLYRRAGFVEIPPFGDYQPDPLSLFMELRLDR